MGAEGVILGKDEVDGEAVFFVGIPTARGGGGWLIFVLRPHWLHLTTVDDSVEAWELVQNIIEAAEARGCPLRGLYEWSGGYVAPARPSG